MSGRLCSLSAKVCENEAAFLFIFLSEMGRCMALSQELERNILIVASNILNTRLFNKYHLNLVTKELIFHPLFWLSLFYVHVYPVGESSPYSSVLLCSHKDSKHELHSQQ